MQLISFLLLLSPSMGKPPRWTAPASFYGFGVFRVFYLAFLLLTMLPAVLAYSARGPTNQLASNILTGCVASGQYDPTVDYFPDKAGFHGDLFTVSYFNNYKIVNVTSTQYGFTESYLLYQCGTPKPTNYSSLKSFAVPVTNVGCDSTTDATFLELLGKRLSIKLLANSYLFTSPCIQFLVANQTIASLSSNSTIAAAQISSNDVYFADAFNWGYGSPAPASPYVAVDAEDDPSPLKRAEWLEFYAVFFNQEKLASTLFQTVATRYNCHMANAQTYAKKPIVAFVTIFGPPYQEWIVSSAPYKLQLIQDAGGTPLSPGSFASLNELLTALSTVDVLIDQSYPVPANWSQFLALYNLTDQSPYKFVATGSVFQTDRLQNPAGSQAWFENALAQPDLVLRDMIYAIHPEYPFVNDTVWLRKLRNPTQLINVATASQCTDPAASLQLLADACSAFPTPTPSAGTTPKPSSGAASGAAFAWSQWLVLIVATVIVAVMLS